MNNLQSIETNNLVPQAINDSNMQHLYSLMEQQTLHLNQQMQNFNLMQATITGLATEQNIIKKDMENYVTKTDYRLIELEENTEITTEQKDQVVDAVHERCRTILHIISEENNEPYEITKTKYYSYLIKEIWWGVKQFKHISQKYERTTKKNFQPGMNDINNYIPLGGIEGFIIRTDKKIKAKRNT